MKLKDLSITFHTDKIKECVDFYCNNFQAKLTFDAYWYVSIQLESDKPLFLSFQARNPELDYSTCSQFGGGITLTFWLRMWMLAIIGKTNVC